MVLAKFTCRLCGGPLLTEKKTSFFTCTVCGAQQTFFKAITRTDLGIHDMMIDAIQSNDILSVRNDLIHGVSANATTTIRTGRMAYESSALHEAVSTAKNAEMVSLLLEFGADVQEIVHLPFEDRPILSCAILDANSADLVFLLLEAGADPNTNRITHTDHGDRVHSPLQDAADQARNPEISDLLIKFGARLPG